MQEDCELEEAEGGLGDTDGRQKQRTASASHAEKGRGRAGKPPPRVCILQGHVPSPSKAWETPTHPLQWTAGKGAGIVLLRGAALGAGQAFRRRTRVLLNGSPSLREPKHWGELPGDWGVGPGEGRGGAQRACLHHCRSPQGSRSLFQEIICNSWRSPGITWRLAP